MKLTVLLPVIMTFLFAGSFLGVNAQQGTVKGAVNDTETGEPVEFANIRIRNTQYGASSDEHGFFIILNIPSGTYTLEVYMMGYERLEQEIKIETGKILNLLIKISKTAYQLDEVAISAERTRLINQVRISEIELLPVDINNLPAFGSMPDIAQQIRTLPGVVSSGDAGGQIYIRGGSPVQNKVIMDGSVIYNPFHSSGLHSVFDADVIRKADVYTGGFSAEYGGAISSVIDVTNRHGNVLNYSGKADISTIGGKLMVEGPIYRQKPDRKSNASFLLNYRTSYFDKSAETIYSYVDQELPFSFRDFYGKISLFTGNVSRIDLYGFSFHDRTGIEGSSFNYSWNNSGFGGNLILSPPQSASLIQGYFSISAFDMTLEEEDNLPRTSGVNSVNFGIRFNNYFGSNFMKYGVELLSLKTDYYFYSTQFNTTEQTNNSSEVSAYALYFGKFGSWLVQPGLRTTLYSTLSRISFEPRISIKYLVHEHIRLKVAAGYYTQNLISAVSDRDIVNYFRGYLSAPVSVTSSKEIKNIDYLLQTAWHLVAGFEIDLIKRLFINMEAYYKDYPQLINYNRDKLFNEVDNPEEPEVLTKDFILETGFSRGIEFSASYRSPVFTASGSYSLGETRRSYESAEGEVVTYYPHYDRRHTVNLQGMITLDRKKSWELNLHWTLGSGFPYTPTQGYFEFVAIDENQQTNYLEENGNPGIFYGDYNSARLPVYHRLDFSLKKKINLKGKSKMEAEFNIINVYNQKNIYYVNRYDNTIIYQLPFLPGFRLGYSF